MYNAMQRPVQTRTRDYNWTGLLNWGILYIIIE
jgi:hypothetical protein